MTTTTIRYLGDSPLREEPITGSKLVWDYGQTNTVDTVIASQLLTTGLFQNNAGQYATVQINPLCTMIKNTSTCGCFFMSKKDSYETTITL